MPKAKIAVFFRSIIYTLAIIAIFGIVGYELDQITGKSPAFLIGSVLVSYPFTRVFLRKKIRAFAEEKMRELAGANMTKKTTK